MISWDSTKRWPVPVHYPRPIWPRKTATNERYVREWLAQQAAAGYLNYEPASARYVMTPEQEMVFAAEGSPAFMLGAFEIVGSMMRDEAKITEVFKTGKGVGWHEHDAALFSGTERFFRPGYGVHLLVNGCRPSMASRPNWSAAPASPTSAAATAVTTILMAKAFPRSTFTGFDYHQPSLDRAAAAAKEAGVAGN